MCRTRSRIGRKGVMCMGKATMLFPFRGQMVSAYRIAKAYGRQEDYWMIRRRLMDGMSAEEAVMATQSAKKEAAPSFGIQPWEINRIRTHLKPGDKLRVRVYYATLGQDTSSTRVEACRVTGVYPHLVTLRRPCGLITSKTYIDLLLEGVRA